MAPRALGLTLAAALTLAACGGGQEQTVDYDSTAPLEALPECDPPPEPVADGEVTGLTVPEGTIVTEVMQGDPLTTVNGYVPMTPIAVRRYYEDRDDLEILVIEDEVFEAEVLVSDGAHRTYVRANAMCAEGSSVLAVVAPELEGDELPVPQGVPAPGTPPTSADGS